MKRILLFAIAVQLLVGNGGLGACARNAQEMVDDGQALQPLGVPERAADEDDLRDDHLVYQFAAVRPLSPHLLRRDICLVARAGDVRRHTPLTVGPHIGHIPAHRRRSPPLCLCGRRLCRRCLCVAYHSFSIVISNVTQMSVYFF